MARGPASGPASDRASDRASDPAIFVKMATKAFTKIKKKPYFPYFLMNSAMQYMNLTFSDITESKFCTKNFKMAAIFKMAAKMASKIQKSQ